MTFTVTGEMVSTFVVSLLMQLAMVYGALRLWQGGISARLEAVEGHSTKVDKIAPIETELAAFKEQMAAFKDQIGAEFKHLREDVREMGRATQAMALALAKAGAASG